MTRLYMLDTNTVSYVLNGRSQAARLKLANLRKDQVPCISTITEAELLYGVHRRALGERRTQAVQTFLNRVRVLPFGRDEAEAYGRLRADQEAIGKPLGALDTLIAAHAVATGAVLVSNDAVFQNVAGLERVEAWATDLQS